MPLSQDNRVTFLNSCQIDIEDEPSEGWDALLRFHAQEGNELVDACSAFHMLGSIIFQQFKPHQNLL